MYFSNSKKSLDNFPLDVLAQTAQEAMKAIEAEIVDTAKRNHLESAQKLIAKKYSNREDSFEGDLEEECPFIPPAREYIQEQRSRIKKEVVSAFCDKYNLKENSSWLLPQISASIAKIPLTFDDLGYVNVKEYLSHFGSSDKMMGVWFLCTHPLRGDLMQKQYLPENRNYSALVPLLLMPHKRFNGIEYSKWPKADLSKVVDPNLYEAMVCDYVNDMPKDELIELRDKGLEYKTGKLAGKVRSAATSHKIYSIPSDFRKLPWLVQVMMFQIWCAHPNNRSDVMVLDWINWDNTPEPLVDGNIFIGTKKTIEFNTRSTNTSYDFFE